MKYIFPFTNWLQLEWKCYDFFLFHYVFKVLANNMIEASFFFFGNVTQNWGCKCLYNGRPEILVKLFIFYLYPLLEANEIHQWGVMVPHCYYFGWKWSWLDIFFNSHKVMITPIAMTPFKVLSWSFLCSS
jgi:hypothetical protein